MLVAYPEAELQKEKVRLREVHAECVLPACEELTALAQRCRSLVNVLREIQPLNPQDDPPFSLDLTQLTSYGARLTRLAEVLSEVTSATLALRADIESWIRAFACG